MQSLVTSLFLLLHLALILLTVGSLQPLDRAIQLLAYGH
jgi:hypothetical protein